MRSPTRADLIALQRCDALVGALQVAHHYLELGQLGRHRIVCVVGGPGCVQLATGQGLSGGRVRPCQTDPDAPKRMLWGSKSNSLAPHPRPSGGCRRRGSARSGTRDPSPACRVVRRDRVPLLVGFDLGIKLVFEGGLAFGRFLPDQLVHLGPKRTGGRGRCALPTGCVSEAARSVGIDGKGQRTLDSYSASLSLSHVTVTAWFFKSTNSRVASSSSSRNRLFSIRSTSTCGSLWLSSCGTATACASPNDSEPSGE